MVKYGQKSKSYAVVLKGDGSGDTDTTTTDLDMGMTLVQPETQVKLVAGEWTDVMIEFRGSNGKRKSNFESQGLDKTIDIRFTDPQYTFNF